MRTGEERYLPTRDKGPVRRFIRNYVDARISVAEFLLPLLLVIMVMQYSGVRDLVRFSASLWTVTLLLVALDTLWLLFRLKRALRAEVPRREPEGHHLLHDHAGAPAALAADAQAPGQDRRRTRADASSAGFERHRPVDLAVTLEQGHRGHAVLRQVGVGLAQPGLGVAAGRELGAFSRSTTFPSASSSCHHHGIWSGLRGEANVGSGVLVTGTPSRGWMAWSVLAHGRAYVGLDEGRLGHHEHLRPATDVDQDLRTQLDLGVDQREGDALAQGRGERARRDLADRQVTGRP